MTRLADVLVPPNEEGTRATVLRWCKQVGDTVVKDEPLVELETDKVTVEIPAPASGTLVEVLKEANDEVQPRRSAGPPAAWQRQQRRPGTPAVRHRPSARRRRAAVSAEQRGAAAEPVESRGAAAARGACDCRQRTSAARAAMDGSPRRTWRATWRLHARRRTRAGTHRHGARDRHAAAAHRHSPARGRAHGAQPRRGAACHHLVRGGSDTGAGASGAARGRLRSRAARA